MKDRFIISDMLETTLKTDSYCSLVIKNLEDFHRHYFIIRFWIFVFIWKLRVNNLVVARSM